MGKGIVESISQRWSREDQIEKSIIAPVPGLLMLELTNACNLSCSMCYNSRMKRKIGFMSLELAEKILDEAREKAIMSLKQKLKRAFSIILGAYFTAVVALIPLLWAGAGLLKGFAITTIIGISVGVLITRPAFTDMVKKFEEKNVS